MKCQAAVTEATAQVEHERPACDFERPAVANRLDDLQTSGVAGHKRKTETYRRTESLMR